MDRIKEFILREYEEGRISLSDAMEDLEQRCGMSLLEAELEISEIEQLTTWGLKE